MREHHLQVSRHLCYGADIILRLSYEMFSHRLLETHSLRHIRYYIFETLARTESSADIVDLLAFEFRLLREICYDSTLQIATDYPLSNDMCDWSNGPESL